ncbi:hypothetical protein ASNO1_44510 [Corallococcus caeni]|uniref:Secreted protein n=1 Tax=Corallococcus caeni TaxID=3082388 RepID=A0ABQ6QW00_9BACT|nr:hypothetical protein ASNO1_44510 [Corallococcus sp. NO1]
MSRLVWILRTCACAGSEARRVSAVVLLAPRMGVPPRAWTPVPPEEDDTAAELELEALATAWVGAASWRPGMKTGCPAMNNGTTPPAERGAPRGG